MDSKPSPRWCTCRYPGGSDRRRTFPATESHTFSFAIRSRISLSRTDCGTDLSADRRRPEWRASRGNAGCPDGIAHSATVSKSSTVPESRPANRVPADPVHAFGCSRCSGKGSDWSECWCRAPGRLRNESPSRTSTKCKMLSLCTVSQPQQMPTKHSPTASFCDTLTAAFESRRMTFSGLLVAQRRYSVVSSKSTVRYKHQSIKQIKLKRQIKSRFSWLQLACYIYIHNFDD